MKEFNQQRKQARRTTAQKGNANIRKPEAEIVARGRDAATRKTGTGKAGIPNGGTARQVAPAKGGDRSPHSEGGRGNAKRKAESVKAKAGTTSPRPSPQGGEGGGEIEAALEATEVARLLGFKAVTVRGWAACGRIRGRRIGGRWRFFWSEVRASLGEAESGTTGPAKAGTPNPQHPTTNIQPRTSNLEHPGKGPAKAGTTNGSGATGRAGERR